MCRPAKRDVCVYIRWMIRRDMPEVLAIEGMCFEFPWNEEEFICCLQPRNCIGMVAEHNERVVGFMVYSLRKNRIHVLNFAVHPEFQRRGIGTAMVRRLINKLSLQRRNRLILEIWERNLHGQLFFRALDFRCISILRGFYTETDDEAYQMQYRCKSVPSDQPEYREEAPQAEAREPHVSSNPVISFLQRLVGWPR